MRGNYDLRSDDLSLDGDDWEKTYAGFLVLSWNLFDGWRTRAQISKSKSQMRQADIAYDNLRDLIELEVRSAYLDFQSAQEKLKSQEMNVEHAEEGLRIANERYRQGMATNLEVMDAQLALTTARTNRIQALYELNVSAAKLKKAMGTIIDDFVR